MAGVRVRRYEPIGQCEGRGEEGRTRFERVFFSVVTPPAMERDSIDDEGVGNKGPQLEAGAAVFSAEAARFVALRKQIAEDCVERLLPAGMSVKQFTIYNTNRLVTITRASMSGFTGEKKTRAPQIDEKPRLSVPSISLWVKICTD